MYDVLKWTLEKEDVDTPGLQGLQFGIRFLSPSGSYLRLGYVRFDILNYFPVPMISTSDKCVSTPKANGRNYV